ncbi:hypothetical protein CANARDRAFT_174597 [[Candida] arabinofermentans NRRL YB-2248]|uniref:Ubiquinone biosynthesis O-methyltransferase, mitochondrial n=1 Tax=[Candida] arabinofermentans NRRL YB-2248 TaxID=983967 RepID=A0A1E4T748_9ASCO|nr:hypothetical protein CANARDRAFT_174597 [[Candida] arabinofermentans NRRL YB-2248]
MMIRNQLNRESEKDHFNGLAATWWDTQGSQRILHKMNLIRMDFINDTIKKNLKLNKDIVNDEEDEIFIPGWNFKGILPTEVSQNIQFEQTKKINEMYSNLKLDCLDIGCGGGILTESLARLPIVSKIKGIDLSPEVLKVAKQHMKLDPILSNKLEYELKAVEDLNESDMYDIVTMMEMLEHVDHPAIVLREALQHVKPGGYLFLSTINRDLISWFTTIFMGEYVLKIVPIGTHTYSKYINDFEIKEFAQEFKDEFKVIDSKGCIYLPLYGWKFTKSSGVGNYFLALQRKG